MRTLIEPVETVHTPESLAANLHGEPGVVLLRSGRFDLPHARYSYVTAQPFLTLRSWGASCQLSVGDRQSVQFGSPWSVMESLLGRYELLNEADLPFPLGGCFGYWGYDLKNFVEPRLPRRAVRDLDLPDCHLGFYPALVVFDHHLDRTWLVVTGLGADGSRDEHRARQQLEYWRRHLHASSPAQQDHLSNECSPQNSCRQHPHAAPPILASNVTHTGFLDAVRRAQAYIRAGDIYQVNLSHRLTAPYRGSGWDLFQRLCAASPAPFAAYLDCGRFQLASSSPELFLRLSGSQVLTRPIKGTRPRSSDPLRDAQLTYELQTSGKELAELVMITDLLRNDLGRVCEYGTVFVPDLLRVERFAHVQHHVSTVEGRLRPEVTHLAALAACFPGGSITGAPKFRAMEIIDELEPLARGPYTGCLGYLGFNRESQLSIVIRTAVRLDQAAYFHVGAGIVADSVPKAEYEETLVKARGFRAAIDQAPTPDLKRDRPSGHVAEPVTKVPTPADTRSDAKPGADAPNTASPPIPS